MFRLNVCTSSRMMLHDVSGFDQSKAVRCDVTCLGGNPRRHHRTHVESGPGPGSTILLYVDTHRPVGG